jgi:spore maturation protein CgeB
MRILILNTDYPRFLGALYADQPSLMKASYAEQMQARNRSLFGVADFYSRNFKAYGHEAAELHVNNRILQYAWARENGLLIDPPPTDRGIASPTNATLSRMLSSLRPLFRPAMRKLRPFRMPDWEVRVLLAQVEALKPDVILNQAMEYVRSPILELLRAQTRLIVGQIAAPRPEGEDYRIYDLIISSLPNFVEWFSDRGARARYNQLAFEPAVLGLIGPEPERDIPLSFVGSLSPAHAGRVAWLEEIARNTPLQVWGNGIEQLPPTSPLHAAYRGEAWGRQMYDVLRRSRITLNYHINIADGWANNMRLYEATGAGALLLTDRQRNIGDIYIDGTEVATYSSTRECIDQIERYLADEPARAAIAASGQRKALTVNNYFIRAGEILHHLLECDQVGPRRYDHGAEPARYGATMPS